MATDKIGEYQLLARLGSGGTGTVFKALQKTLGRTVALKVLHPGYARNASLLKRFKREIQTTAALNHPNLVKVYDAGQDGDHHYFSMEFVEGYPLREKVRGGQKVAPPEAVRISIQLADALRYFHSKGMIHRDIKPENIMLDASGTVKLMDFGIVKVQDSTVITQEGSTLGTPRYMSPEMVCGEPQDQRSDIYQAGVVLYEMLTGACPFDGPTISAIATQITDVEPRPPSLVDGALPPVLDRIVLRCLAKDARNRYADASELENALKAAEVEIAVGAAAAAAASAGDGAAAGAGTNAAASPRAATAVGSPGSDAVSHGAVTDPVARAGSRPPRADPGRRVATFPIRVEQVAAVANGQATRVEAGDWLERSFRSVKITLDEPGMRRGLLLAPVAFFVGLVAVWFAVGRGPFMVSALLAHEGLTGLGVSWETRSVCETEVEVVEADGGGGAAGAAGATPRRFRNNTETRVTRHTILIKDLRKGSDYHVRAVHPDGSRSEPVLVRLTGATTLLAGPPEVVLKPGPAVEIVVRTNVPSQARIRFVRSGQSVARDLSPGWSREHRMVLENVSASEEISDVKLVVEGVDERIEPPLPPLFGGTRMSQELIRAVGGLSDRDFEEAARKVYRSLVKPTGSAAATAPTTGIPVARSALAAWMRERGVDRTVEAARLLSGWVFGPGGTDVENQIDAYHRLQRLEDLDYLAYSLAKAPLVEVQSIYRPFVDVRYVDNPGNGRIVLDNLGRDQVPNYMGRKYRERYKDAFVVFDGQYYTQGKLTRDVDLSDMSTRYHGASSKDFEVTAEELAGSDRFRLIFQVANVRPDVYLDVTLNNRLTLRVRGNPALDLPFDLKSMFMQSEDLEKRSGYVVMVLPARLLTAGKNRLAITADSIPGLAPVLGASLLRVLFRMEPRGA
jgi:serine/threonine-protein kinase